MQKKKKIQQKIIVSDILNYNIIKCNKIGIKNLFEIQNVYQQILTSVLCVCQQKS